MFVYIDWPPEGFEVVPGMCPAAAGAQGKPVACNCTGACAPTLRRVVDTGHQLVLELPQDDKG